MVTEADGVVMSPCWTTIRAVSEQTRPAHLLG